jgi:hypothetical protein
MALEGAANSMVRPAMDQGRQAAETCPKGSDDMQIGYS